MPAQGAGVAPYADARDRQPALAPRARRGEARQERRPVGDRALPARGPAGRRRGARATAPSCSSSCSRPRRRSSGYPDIARGRRARPGSRSSSSPSTCSTRWPTPSRRRASSRSCRQFPTSVKDIFAGVAAAHRDPRGGARSRQRGHDHPGRGCRGCRRRHPHRSHASTSTTPRSCARRRARSSTCPSRSASSSTTCVERAHGRRAAGDRRRRQGRRLPRARSAALLAEPTAWLFGNEARGLDDEALALADRVAHGADLRQRRVDEPRDRGQPSASTRAPSRSAA